MESSFSYHVLRHRLAHHIFGCIVEQPPFGCRLEKTMISTRVLFPKNGRDLLTRMVQNLLWRAVEWSESRKQAGQKVHHLISSLKRANLK